MPGVESVAAPGLERPYPGLRSFEPWEGFLFFGRETHTSELLRRLSGSRFLAVVGTSGSGKSSLVRAGLLPALYRGYLIGAASRWRIAVIRPGNSPLTALASALAAQDVLACSSTEALQRELESTSFGLVNAVRDAHLPPGESVLVVVDQFEELFRFARDDGGPKRGADASLFVSLLLRAAEEFDAPIYVVTTMRSDFLGDCTRFAGLAEALNQSQYLIPRLSLDQRQAAIERPLQLAGARITPRLVQRVLTDAGDDPDQLPVMQHALMRTYRVWQARGTSDPLDLDDYLDASRSGSALNQHADELYGDVPDAAKPWAERLFRCITTKHEGKPVRRSSQLRWIYAVTRADSPEKRGHINEVIRRFALPEHSLLFCSTGDRLGFRSVIEISHESLIRKWLRLQQWLDAESESASWFVDVADRIARQTSSLRDPDLARVERFKAVNGWNACWAAQYRSKRRIRFSQVEEFLARSRKEQEEENRRTRAAKERERRLLWAGVGLLVLLVASLYSNVVSRSRALNLSLTLNQRQQEAEAAAQRVKDAEVALLQAPGASEGDLKKLEADLSAARANADASAANEQSARDNLARLQGQLNLARPPDAGAAPKPTSDVQAQIAQLQQEKDRAIASQRRAEEELKTLKESVDRERAGPSPPAPDRADARTGVPPPALPADREPPAPSTKVLTPSAITASTILAGHEDSIVQARFSANGQRVVTAGKDNKARVWDAQSGRLVATLDGHRNTVNTAEFSRDGKLVLTAGDNTARLWDAESGKPLRSFSGHQGTVTTAAFSRDGTQVVTSSEDRTARVWDVESGSVVANFLKHKKIVLSAAFSPNGKRVVSAGWDETAWVWDAETGQELHILRGHKGWIRGAAFSPDGKRVVTAGDDKTARTWDVESGVGLHTLKEHRWRVGTAVFSPDGKRIVTVATDLDRTARVWDAETGRLLAQLEHADYVKTAAFSEDSRWVVTGSNKTAWVWDVVESGRPLATLIGHQKSILSAVFSPKGDRVVTAGDDNMARIWKVDGLSK